MTGSQTAPKTKSAWDAIRARSQQQAEEANAIVDEMIAMEEEQEQQKRDAEAAQEIQRAWVRYREDYLKQNADAWKQFREDYSPFYAQLAESSTAAREMMANDFARGEDPVQTLYDYVYEQETEGLDRTKDLPAARYRTHARLRKMLGDELYAKYYPDKKSPAERVADAHAETDRIIDEGGESETESATETGSDQTQARGGDQTTDSSAEKTSGTEEGGAPAETQTGTDGDEQTDRDSGEQRSEPTPTDTEGRAAIDAERQAMSEAEGDEDIVRWQHQDGTWEDTPVQYKLVERRSAVASHRLTDDGVSYEQNPTYNWEMDIQRRTDARGEEILDRSRDENRNMRLLTERGQDMSRGAPTLLPSYDAAGGNHRLMMLELIYNRDGDGKQEYLEALEKDLPNFGIDPAALEGFEEPVLVRQVLGELDDPAAFAEASNQPNAAPRTTAHQAQQDADALTPEIIDKFDFGEVGGSNRRTIADMMAQPSKRNHDALLAFIENLPPQARARYRRGDTTRLAPEARHYLENAFFAAMFDTERGAALYEMKENGTFVPNQNYTALMIALPHIVKLDAFLRNYRPDVHKLAISDDVAAAFHSISSLRGEPTNMTVGQLGAHLDTQPFADDPSITTEAHMIMKAIYASQSQRLISDLLVGYVANAINTIQASGVPVAEQDPLFEGGEVYQGPNKEKILATTIEEVTTPKEDETTTDDEQQSLIPEGEKDATPSGDGTERTGDGDSTGDGDTTGGTDERTDTGPDQSVPAGERDSESGGEAQRSESTTEGDGESDEGTRPRGERDAGAEQSGDGIPEGGESQTGERSATDDSTESDESGSGSGGKSKTERVIERMRRKRQQQQGGEQQTTPAAQTTPTETQTTPGEETTPETKSKTDRVIDRMRRKRQQEPKQPSFEPTGLAQFDRISEFQEAAINQQELVNEFIEVFVEDSIEELTAKESLDEFETEILEALQADEGSRSDDQHEIVDIFTETFVEESIEELEAKDSLDDFETEILEALQAYMAMAEEVDYITEATSASNDEIDAETEHVPDSVSIAENHLSPLHESTALAAQKHPSVDNIALDLSDDAWGIVSQAQVLAVKLAKRSTDQKFVANDAGTEMRYGFLLGDGTGSGKTITGLTFILDQIANGNNQHIMIGPSPKLFNDNYKTDMKLLKGPVNQMFAFGDSKHDARVKKKAGIGFTTYTALSGSTGYANLKTGKIGLRTSQLLEYLSGKRPPLEVLNPDAVGTLEWLKGVGKGQMPTFQQVLDAYVGQEPIDQNELIDNLPKALGTMLNSPKSYTQKKYDAVLKILNAFDNYDTTYKVDSMDDFMTAALDYEGVILFDEAHNMRGDDSITRRIGATIQRAFPNARVMYMTATPITKVEEIQYATRLGLWGPNQPFKTYSDFERAFAGDDLTAKEIIAKDLKGYGRYLRRSLDMSGVRWENKEHALTDAEKVQYDMFVKVMREIKQTIQLWVDRQQLENEAKAHLKGQIMQGYYNFQQEFFNQLQTSYKTRAFIPEMIEHLKDGKKVAVQLSTTGETAQKRAEERAGKGQEPELNLKNLLIDFLMRESSAIYARHPKVTGRGTDYTRDDKGNLIVQSKTSVQERDALVHKISQLQSVPELAIDMLHSAMRAEGFPTAEITGRNEYYVREKDGTLKKYKNPKSTNEISRQFRETRDLNFMIITDAGSEGINLHTKREDSPIVDYDIDAGWNVVKTIQKFGRFKRTGAAHDPVYILTETDSPATKRRVAALANKLMDMGALATGQARSQMNMRDAQKQAEADKDTEDDNYIMGPFGRAAMRDLWTYFHNSRNDANIIQIMVDLGFVDKNGQPKFDEDSEGNLKPSGIPLPHTYLARLYGVEYNKQTEYADMFFNLLDSHLAAASEKGLLDTGATQMSSRNAKVNRRQTIHTHAESGTDTDVVEVTGDQTLQKNSWEVIDGIRTKKAGFEGMASGPFNRIMRNTKSGKVYALFVTTEVEGSSDVRGITRYKRFSPRGKPDYINSDQIASGNFETIWGRDTPDDVSDAKYEEAKKAWQEAEKQAVASRPISRVMITGMLLPVWDRINIKGAHLGARSPEEFMAMIKSAGFRSLQELERSMQIRQIMLADGTPVQGRVIPAQFLDVLFGRFGIRVQDTPFADLVETPGGQEISLDDLTEQIEENKAFLRLDNGAIVSQVGDEIEVVGYFSGDDISELGLTATSDRPTAEIHFPNETKFSERYSMQDTKFGYYRMTAENLPKLLNRFPVDTMTTRSEGEAMIRVEGIKRPDEPDPHPDHRDTLKQYAQFVKVRQLMLPYANQLKANNSRWQQRWNSSKVFYVEDVDKYIIMQRGAGTNYYAIENEHDNTFGVNSDSIYANHAEKILDNQTGEITPARELKDLAIQTVQLYRTLRELGKEDNAKFKPSRDLEAKDIKEFSDKDPNRYKLLTGELPDGQTITISAFFNYQNVWVGVRIGKPPENLTDMSAYSGWFAVTQSIKKSKDQNKSFLGGIDNAIKTLREANMDKKGFDILNRLETRMAELATSYDNHLAAIEAERIAEQERIAQEHDDRASPRTRRRGGDTTTRLALDHEAIASLELKVDKVVATLDDTEIKRRVLDVFAKVMNGEQVNLIGNDVGSIQEMAVLAQAFRNPLIEVYRTVYLQGDKVVAHDGFTLNSSQKTRFDIRKLEERIKENNADGFYMLHNHPTSIARFSGADIDASQFVRDHFGERYKGHVVVDSGTFAQLTYDTNNKPTRREELILTPDDVGWDTSQDPDLHGIRPEDPLYKDFTPEAIAKFHAMYPKSDIYENRSYNPRKGPAPDFSSQEDAPKAIAELGKYLQTRKDFMAVVAMSSTGYIVMMTEFTGLVELAKEGKLANFLYENFDTLGSNILHIIGEGGQDVKDALMGELANAHSHTGLASGIGSIWIDGDSLGTVQPSGRVHRIPDLTIKEGRETEYVTLTNQGDNSNDGTPDENENNQDGEGEQTPKGDSPGAGNQTPAGGGENTQGGRSDQSPDGEGGRQQGDDSGGGSQAVGDASDLIDSILEAIENNNFTDDGDLMEIDLPSGDIVNLSVEGSRTMGSYLTISSDKGVDIEIEIPGDVMDMYEQNSISLDELVQQSIEAYKEDAPDVSQPDTIERVIDGVKQKFRKVKRGSPTELGQPQQRQKRVVVIGGQPHTLLHDESRRNPNQRIPGDAEHMVKTKKGERKYVDKKDFKEVVERIIDTATTGKHQGIRKYPDTFWGKVKRLIRTGGTAGSLPFPTTSMPSGKLQKVLEDIVDIFKKADDFSFDFTLQNEISEALLKYVSDEQGSFGLNDVAYIVNSLSYTIRDISEQEILNQMLEEGVINQSGDGYAYTSYSSYYRKNDKGKHQNGVILDLERILEDHPNITGTIHTWKKWEGRSALRSAAEIRKAMEYADTDKNTVVEIRYPGDLNINKYLVGVVENSEVFVKNEHHPNPEQEQETETESLPPLPNIEFKDTSGDPADAPPPDDESDVISIMPNPDDFNQETRDNTIFQRALNTFWDPAGGLRQILGTATRQAARITRKTISNGFGILEEMSKTDRDGADKIGDFIRKNILRRQFISKSQFSRDASRIVPVLKEFEQYVRKQATPTLTSKASVQNMKRRNAVRQRVNDAVWRFIEDNREIKDPELLAIAKKMKEVWRELLREGTHAMLELTDELYNQLGEFIYITDSVGNKVPWYPESFDGFTWNPDVKMFERNEGTAKNPKFVHYSIDEAHQKANRLYTPHKFDHNKLRQEHRKLKKLIDDMNAVIESDKPLEDENRLKRIGIIPTAGAYQFRPTQKIYDKFEDALEAAVVYWTEQDKSMRGLLEYTDAGLRAERYGQVAPGGQMTEGRIGTYGHLERARETDDKFYERDLRILLETRRLMWDRFAEFSTVGQVDPVIGSSPRLEVILENVRGYRKNKREHALGAVAVALRAGQPDSMFERLPQFGQSIQQGLSVQQDWRMYVDDAKGRRKRTDEYREINIAQMGLTDEVLETLRDIGFITKNSAGVDVVSGETIEDRQLTMARFFYEFYNTVAQREASVKDLYLSLGHWNAKDPLTFDEAKFWQMISDVTTASTLSWSTALQNLLEIPLVTELTGTGTMIRGLTKVFASDSREQLLDLAMGLSHAPRFMAETDLAEKYLGSNWSMFSLTDRISRAAGLGIGLENAKKKIAQYKSANEQRKKALRREFAEFALDVKVIDQIPPSDVDKILEDVQELIMSGNVTPKFGDSGTLTDRLAWTVLQHMHYISDSTFKAYDATSLPPFLMKATPLVRLFMKYKSWMVQHNSFKWKNWRRAARELKQGNFVPMWNVMQSAAWSGVTYGMLLALYAAARGDEEPVDAVKGMHAAQTFGMSSVLLEMASRSDGNWWHMSRDMLGQGAGPAWSIGSQAIAPAITGDWDVAGSQALNRIPVVNVFRRAGGFRLLEESIDAQ